MLELILAKLDPKSINPADVEMGGTKITGARFETVCMALAKVKFLSELTLLTAAGHRDEREQLINHLTAYMAHQYTLNDKLLPVMLAVVERAIDDALTPGRCKKCGGTGDVYMPGSAVFKCNRCDGNGMKLTTPHMLRNCISKMAGKKLSKARVSPWYARYQQVYQIVCSLNSDAWADFREALKD